MWPIFLRDTCIPRSSHYERYAIHHLRLALAAGKANLKMKEIEEVKDILVLTAGNDKRKVFHFVTHGMKTKTHREEVPAPRDSKVQEVG